MHTRLAAPLAFLLACGFSACARPSMRSDLARVRELSHSTVLPKLSNERVAETRAAELDPLLKKPLDANAAVRIAVLNNRALRAQLRELGVSRGQLLQAGLIANPTFEVEALPERDSTYELRVEYEISSLVLAPLRRRAAHAELEAHRIEAAGQVVQLGYEARAAFFALAAAEQRLIYGQRALDALAAGRDAAQALLAAGNVLELDAASQVVAYERARILVAQRELEVADARERMQRLLGLYGKDTQWRGTTDLPSVPEALTLPQDLEARAVQASLDLRALEQRLLAAARHARLSRTEGLLPDLAVDVHALRTDPEGGFDDDSSYRFGGGASLSVPLFDRKQGEVKAHTAEYQVLLERYQGLAVDLRSAVREARNRLVSAHARARQYETVILPAQNIVMEQTQLQYNAMQLDVFRLLSARREQLDVELARVETLREYWEAEAALNALLEGRLLLPGAARGGATGGMGMGSTEAAGGH